MNKSTIIISIFSVFLLVFASFPYSAKVQKIDTKKRLLSNYFDKETLEKSTEKSEKTNWFPGWFIVQLLKGCIAFILILLILLDLIEPEE